MNKLNCWIYPGKTDLMLICDEKIIDAMSVPPAVICKLVESNEQGNWTIEADAIGRQKIKKLLKQFNNMLYIRMPDGSDFTMTA